MIEVGGLPSYADLAARLDVAEQTLGAIQRGEVDGLVVSVDGELRVFTLEGADAFYRALVEQMPEGAAAVSAAGQVLYANSCFAEMLGVPLESLIGADLPTFAQPFHRGRLRDLLLLEEGSEGVDLTLVDADGLPLPVALSVSPVDGYVEGARCVVVVDLTRRQASEAAVREAEAHFRGAFDNAPIGMALLDLSGDAEQVNPALSALAGRPASDLLGKPLPWLRVEGGGVHSALLELLTGRQEQTTIYWRGIHVDGGTMSVATHLTVLRGSGGQPLRIIAQVQDESQRRRHEQQLQHMADHDGLSGLLNRRGFEDALTRHFAVTARYGLEGALLVLDVDHFKYINDTRGHHVGDQILIRLAAALRSRLRESDVVARLGGDEFAILLPRGDATTATRVAQELLAAARAVDVEGLGDSRHLTISVGVVAITEGCPSGGELMALGDLAMYDSKEAGRDRVTVHDPSLENRSPTGDRVTWLSRIESALATGSLLLDAQPIIDLTTGATVQHELLIRLPSATGPVAAQEWFPVAERYGLAHALDVWVVDQAFDLLVRDDYEALNVNVSATSIGRTSWRRHVSEGLHRSGVDAGRITFEITETAAIGNISAAIGFTEDLRRLGCRLALDDFGAGFGSFYYLKHLPFDDVKIDGEFVRDCVNNERDRAIIRAMVDVAGSTGRRTVAECIEDSQTRDLLHEHGVDLAQGFHLGEPAPVVL